MPVIAADENCLVFAYELADTGKPLPLNVAVVRCDECLAVKWGPPNDEALDRHRYYEAGLSYYNVYEVSGSDWIPELETQNAVHSRHFPSLSASYRHFILTFHDSTLEFLAKDPVYRLAKGSPMKAALQAFQDMPQP